MAIQVKERGVADVRRRAYADCQSMKFEDLGPDDAIAREHVLDCLSGVTPSDVKIIEEADRFVEENFSNSLDGDGIPNLAEEAICAAPVFRRASLRFNTSGK